MNIAIVTHQLPSLAVFPSPAEVDTPTEVGPSRFLVPTSLGLCHGMGLSDPIAVGNDDNIVWVVFVSQVPETALNSEQCNSIIMCNAGHVNYTMSRPFALPVNAVQCVDKGITNYAMYKTLYQLKSWTLNKRTMAGCLDQGSGRRLVECCP